HFWSRKPESRPSIFPRSADPGEHYCHNNPRMWDSGQAYSFTRLARSLRVSTRGTARGAFVRSSKSGDGQPSPSTHQPNIFDARRAKTPSDGGAGAFGGRGPTAERSQMRQSRGARTPPPATPPP